MDIRRETSRKKSVFYICYFTFFSFLIIAILIGLKYLWGVLGNYEQCLPEYVIENIVNSFKNKDYESIYTSANISLSEFEDKLTFNSYMENKISKGEIIAQKEPKSKSLPNELVYSIFSGENKLASVSLNILPEKSKYGFKKYEVGGLSNVLNAENSVTILAPDTAKVFLNGIEVSQKYVSEKDLTFSELKNIPEGYPQPRLVKYYINGLIFEPKITATGYLGNNLEATKNDKTGEIVIFPNATQSFADELSPMVVEVAQTYTKYVTKDTTFAELSKYFMKEISLYKYLSNLDVNFYADHDKYEFLNTKTSNFKMYSDECFSCDISYDHYVYRTSHNKKYHYPSNLTFYFLKKNDKWQVFNMNINS